MIKSLICLIWGHQTFNKIAETTVPGHNVKRVSNYTEEFLLRTLKGYTTVALHCPRCNKIKTITH